jgi:hypothetical protein
MNLKARNLGISRGIRNRIMKRRIQKILKAFLRFY